MGQMSEINLVATEQQPAVRQTEALELHHRIMTNSQIAANAIIALAENLKEMRDKKLYIELGYDDFDSYCEKEAGFKKRQAYNFITVLENLGPEYMQAKATLGITKLVELTKLSDVDREALEEKEDLESISVRELQQLVDELREKCDQMRLEAESTVDQKEMEIRKEAEKRAKKELNQMKKLMEEKQKSTEAVLQQELAEKQKIKEQKQLLEQTVEKLKKEQTTLQAKAKLPTGNVELLKYHFENVNLSFAKIKEILSRLDEDQRQTFKGGFSKMINMFLDQLIEL